MENTVVHPMSISKIKNIVFDLLALLFIYLVPAISHLFSFPVYYLEPMRIMLILAIVHTTRKNAYLIAFTLPLFSLLISAHPSLVKTFLVTGELLLNVWLFFLLSEKLSNKTLSIFLSIVVSKIFYYLVKFLLVTSTLIDGDLIATPIYIQIIMLFVLSGYIYLMSYDRRE
ncbi:MAG: hypothetical protein MUE64_03120 [Ignavibacteriaceae bacterium]|jgi:hypothetical protein|nr:hypothetical protein [Ignavibacteriaceae bacterium]